MAIIGNTLYFIFINDSSVKSMSPVFNPVFSLSIAITICSATIPLGKFNTVWRGALLTFVISLR